MKKTSLSFFIHPSVIGLFLTFFMACNGSSSSGKCKYGAPKAIFSDSIPHVKKHFFQLKEGTGVEMIAFDNKLLLEIEQSGCQDIHQQFSFIMFGKFPTNTDDILWKELAIRHFRDLSKLDPQLRDFSGWADAIESVKTTLKLSEPIDIQGNIQIRIDKILSSDKATLVVQFFKK